MPPHAIARLPLLRTCLGLGLLGVHLAAPSQPLALAEPQLKAQVLFKVLRFIEWPPRSLAEGQALQLCLLDEGTPLAQELRALEGRNMDNHVLLVRSVRDRQMGGCHIVLIGEAQGQVVAPPATLLVSESPGMLERGAMLNLQVEDGRVVFDVSLEAARRAGLDISAKLLRLARFVKKP